MARQIARGIESVAGMNAKLRTVAEPTSADKSESSDNTPEVDLEDLRECSGMVLGSPSRFGNMAAPLKYFLETTTMWLSAALAELRSEAIIGTMT